MASREQILKAVFKHGVEKFDKEVLEKLFKPGKGKLYRHEWNPDELAKKGFQPSRVSESSKEALSKGGQGYNRQEAEVFDEVRGLYYYPYKKRPESIYWDGPSGGRGGPESINVTGIKRPGAETVNYGNFEDYGRKPSKNLEISSAKDVPSTADFVHDMENGPWGSEMVQRNQGNVLAKIKTSIGNIYRILGLTGAFKMMEDTQE